ncbi:MAG: hypothetical protein JJU02_11040 [Cryomorphaceae bacterium]|nr:hypothetical protein [Cryomorphaceae bacterium]
MLPDSTYVKSEKINSDSLREIVTSQQEVISKLTETINQVTLNDKLFGLFSYDTVFTVATTLSIFILGILIDRFIKNCEIKEDRKELRLFFKTFLDRIIDSTCDKLSKSYKDFYQSIDIDSGIPTTPPKILTGDFDRLNRIDDNKLFHAIKEKEPFSKLLSNIDFVERLIPEIDRYHAHCRKESDILRTPLQEMINDYMDLLADYVEHVRVTNPNYPHCAEFRDQVNDAVIRYHRDISRTRQLKKFYREILRPIQEKVIETNIFRVDQKGFQIADLGKRISYQYNYLKRLVIEFKLDYRKFYNYTKDSKEKLNIEREKITWR